MTAIDSTPYGKTPAQVRWALAGLSLSTLMPSLDTSIANSALPVLANVFGASFHAVQWIVLAYLLTITSLIISAGRLGDVFGRRRLLLGGIALFTVASLFCGIATTLPLLIAARAAQGLGAAVMMVLSMAVAGETVSKEKTGSAMGLLGTMSAIGTTLGPSLGGIMMSALGWRTIFLVNVPLGLVNLLLAARYVPQDRAHAPSSERGRFDGAGTLLLVLTLGTYALAMTTGHGTFGALNGALLAIAVFSAILFVGAEGRATTPLVRMSLFGEPALRDSLLMSALVSTVMMATLVVGPFYLSRGLGLAPIAVGLMLSVGPFVAALTGVPAGRLVDRFGTGRMTAAGLGAAVVGCAALSMLPLRIGITGYVTPIVVLTAGYALFQAANNTALMTGAAPLQRGVIAGMLSLSRNLGLITGASVMGALFALASRTAEVSTANAAAVASGMRITFAVAAVLMASALTIAAGSIRHRVAFAAAVRPERRGRRTPPEIRTAAHGG